MIMRFLTIYRQTAFVAVAMLLISCSQNNEPVYDGSGTPIGFNKNKSEVIQIMANSVWVIDTKYPPPYKLRDPYRAEYLFDTTLTLRKNTEGALNIFYSDNERWEGRWALEKVEGKPFYIPSSSHGGGWYYNVDWYINDTLTTTNGKILAQPVIRQFILRFIDSTALNIANENGQYYFKPKL